MCRATCIATLCAFLFATPAAMAITVQLGVMGDSLSDEYAEASYGLYAQNWVEQLVIHGGIDVGPTGSWGEPRRNVYEYNWARSGATSATVLSGGQHTGLAGQVAPKGIDYAVLMIGANDFSPSSAAYQNIYAGTWSQPTIDTYVAGVVANINTTLDTVLSTGVKLVLVNAPDYGVTPTVQSFFPDPARRQNVADVVNGQLNPLIEGIAQTRQLPYMDFFGAGLNIFGPHNSLNSTLKLGNVDIFLMQSDTSVGGNPTAGFVHDGIHPNTTVQGIIANTVLEALNIGYGAMLPLFTEAEILSHRGIAYGGSDTLIAQLGNYSDYVTDYAPIFLMGDITKDGMVNAADYTAWANAFGQTGSGILADLNNDGIVGAADYTAWANNFGMMVGGDAPQAVPEPSALALALVGGLGLLLCVRRAGRG